MSMWPQRAGFDVPTGRGVVGAATLEGTVGVPIGAIAGYGTGKTKKAEVKALDTLAKRFTGEDTVTPTPVGQEEAIEILSPNDLSDDEAAALLKEFGDAENNELVDSLKILSPEEQADLDAGKEVTRKNYVRVGKYYP